MFAVLRPRSSILFFFFFNDTATTEIYTLSLTTLFRSRWLGDAGAGLLSALGCRHGGAAQPRSGDGSPQGVAGHGAGSLVAQGSGTGLQGSGRAVPAADRSGARAARRRLRALLRAAAGA